MGLNHIGGVISGNELPIVELLNMRNLSFVKINSNFEGILGHKMKKAIGGPKFESYEALL